MCIRILGTALLAALAAACFPLTVPKLFGFQIYSVISGSMAPAIPTGSLAYIRNVSPADVQTDDVIAFYAAQDSASVIMHRVVENRTVMGAFITKGDANQTEDRNPIPYEHLIGEVACSIPWAGVAASVLTSRLGKYAAVGVIVATVLLHMLASLLERERERV